MLITAQDFLKKIEAAKIPIKTLHDVYESCIPWNESKHVPIPFYLQIPTIPKVFLIMDSDDDICIARISPKEAEESGHEFVDIASLIRLTGH